jgi:hypothetical protein
MKSLIHKINFISKGGVNLNFFKEYNNNKFKFFIGRKFLFRKSESEVGKNSEEMKINSTKKDKFKKDFENLLKETKTSTDLKDKKASQDLNDDGDIKEQLDKIKKENEEKSKKLKKEFENKINEDMDKEYEINKLHLFKKIKSVWMFNQQATKGSDGAEDAKKSEGEENKNKDKKKDTNQKFKTSKKEEEDKPNPAKKYLYKFVDIWKRTFPGEQNMEKLMEERKLQAQNLKSKIKEPTDEEIAAIEETIPEWKRGAIIQIEAESVTEKRSIFEMAGDNISRHVRNLKLYQDAQKSFENSELNLLMEDLKVSYSNIKENLKESQNPFLVVSRDLMDRVSFKSPSSQAISIMRKHDPNFDLILFEKEVHTIFKQLITASVRDDMDLIRNLAGESALAILSSEVKSRKERVRI